MLPLLLALLIQAPPEPAVPGALIERRLAEAVPLSLGDTVRIRALGETEEHPFVIEGVFERAADPARIARNEFEIRLHLPDLEAMLPTRDRVDRFAVVLAPGASADSAARWIEGLAFGTRVYPVAELADESSATFRVVSRFHRAIGVITIVASAIFLLCVMVIRIDERRADIRVLRLIGVSRRSVFRAVTGEAIVIALVGSVVGGLLGIGITRLVNAYYMHHYDTTLRFAIVTPRIVIIAVVLGLILGAVAGALAASRVVRLRAGGLGERGAGPGSDSEGGRG